MLCLKLFEACAKSYAYLFGAAQEFGRIDQLDGLESCDTRDRVAAIGAAHAARVCGVEQFGAADNRGDRHARAHRLGHRDEIRNNAGVLDGEEFAGATKARLDFVGDHHDSVLVTDRSNLFKEWLWCRDETAFALDWFDDDGGDCRWVDMTDQRFAELLDRPANELLGVGAWGTAQHVRERNPVDLRREWPEPLFEEPVLARHRHRHVCAPVIGAFKDEDSGATGGGTSELDCALHRFGTRVHEQCLLREVPGRSGVQCFGQVDHRVMGCDDAADVEQLVCLVLDGLDNGWRTVASGEHANTPGEVQKLVAIDVGDDGAIGGLDSQFGQKCCSGAHRCAPALHDLRASRSRYRSLELNRRHGQKLVIPRLKIELAMD